jgi:hypothetical protein
LKKERRYLMAAMMASITSELLFFLPFILLAVLTFYTTKVAKCHGAHRTKKRRPNLPPGSVGWPFIGETFGYLRAHPATSVGHFMNQHIARSVPCSLFICAHPWIIDRTELTSSCGGHG